MVKLAFHLFLCGDYEIRACGRFKAIVKVTSDTRIVIRLIEKLIYLALYIIKNNDNKIDKFL